MRVHHIALRTRKMRALERFYREILGLPLLERTDRSVWLDAAGTLVMIERADRGEPGIPAGSREFVAFSVSRTEHEKLLVKLTRHRVAIEASTAFTSYFRDPDGRRVGISHFRRARRRTV